MFQPTQNTMGHGFFTQANFQPIVIGVRRVLNHVGHSKEENYMKMLEYDFKGTSLGAACCILWVHQTSD